MSKPKKPLPWSFMKYLQFGTETKPKPKPKPKPKED